MTQTFRRLARIGRPHAVARAGAVALGGAGAVLGVAALGVALAPRLAPIALAWLAVAATVVVTLRAAIRAARAVAPARLAPAVEAAGTARPGTVRGALAPPPAPGVSAELFAAADARAAALVDGARPGLGRALGRGTARRVIVGGAVALAGAMALGAADPASGRAAAFWRPLAAWRAARSPVHIAVDRARVRRGDSVTVAVRAAGAVTATLWTRAPGETWRPAVLRLDSLGHATRTVGPLDADVLLRATAGGRGSPTLRVTVALPLFAGELELVARFPAYLDRPDEPLVAGPDPVAIPVGTRITVRGAASAPLAAARWRGPGGAVALRVRETRFDGVLAPRSSGAWSLELEPAAGDAEVEPPPPLRLVLVPDSAPVVSVPVPGADTAAPLSLRQPLVIDARDDHGVARVTIVSWRVSQTGRVDPAVRESLVVDGGDRIVVQGELDLERRSLLPGDTLRFYVEAWDAAPAPQRGVSREFALRLPSRAELRAATRAAAAAAASAADSVAAAQGELAERARDLAQERARADAAGGGGEPGALPFRASERAAELARQQAALEARAADLARAIDDVARAVAAAGLQDTAFLAQLAEVRGLIERALTPELAQRLRELQSALERLDPEGARQALQRLAEAQQQLREELERSRELFRRAAVEGALSTLAADAAELARRQEEWTTRDAPRADSAAAAAERALGARVDSLAAELERAGRDLLGDLIGDSAAARATLLGGPSETAQRAGSEARAAAQAAAEGDARRAVRRGGAATEALDALAAELRADRDSLASAWRDEALAALDRALTEAAALAGRQERVATMLRDGAPPAAVRGEQGAIEEGAAAVQRQVRDAGARHALVSPELQAALEFARLRMAAARGQLEQAQPNPGGAATQAGEALDALNVSVHALARARAAVAGAQSGSGFAEAMEALTRLAGQQQGLAGEGQSLLPSLGQGGQGMLQALRELGARQRALAEQLEQLQASGGSAAAGALAAEARDIARQLDAGRLDRRTVERQERLYRRLLDAGRTLQGEEPDPERDRISRTAPPVAAHRPPVLAPGATGGGPRVRYPTWDELRALTPEQRRLVLEYYRRLNAPTP